MLAKLKVSKGDLQLGKHVGRVLKLLELSKKISILRGKLPLTSFHVSKSKVSLFNLLLHLSIGILVLLLQSNNGCFLLDLGLLKISSELGDLSLSLLVKLNLSSSGSTGFIKSLTKVLKLTGKVRSLSLSLGSSLSLSLKFFLHLFNSGLDLLDGLLDLSNKRLFILHLAHESRGILLLALDGILKLLSGSLKLRDSLLHNLELALNLSSLLLNVGSSTLLLLI